MKILVTSGGTKVPIDLVRNITNMSRGTFGSKIATELLKMGHKVIFLKAKGSKTPMSLTVDITNGYDVGSFTTWYNQYSKYLDLYTEHEYTTFEDYQRSLSLTIGTEHPDIIILAAAVSDYGVDNFVNGKIRSADDFQIKLKVLPKLINKIKEWSPSSILVGFKLMVNSSEHTLIEAAKKSILDSKCDMVVANDMRDIKDGKHMVHLVYPDKECVIYYTDPTDLNYLARVVANESVRLYVPPEGIGQYCV